MSPGRKTLLVSILWVFALAGLLTATDAQAQPITLDGDLSDWVMPDGEMIDECNDVIPLCKSGFDFTRLLVHYDQASDTLFFGVDIMDAIDGCSQSPDPDPTRDPHGVPGDADGDNDESTVGSIACIPGKDQPCNGRDEFYTIDVDTNLNFRFDDPVDLRLKYEGANLTLSRGDGTVIAGWPVDIVLGMKASTTPPNSCPNENPDTYDIEAAIHDYSMLDGVPVCYGVDLIAGSQVDGPVEDFLNDPVLVDNLADAEILVDKTVRNFTLSGAGGEFRNRIGARPGDVINFKVDVTNTGNIRLATLDMVDVLADDFIEIVVESGTCALEMPRTIRCQVTDLDVGQTATFLFTARIDPNAPAKEIINTADATGVPVREGDCGGDPAMDSDNARIIVIDLTCEKLVSVDGGQTYSDSAQAVPGQTVFYKVIVDNQSMADLDMVTMVDMLPNTLDQVAVVSSECSAVGNTVTCSVATLPQGQMVTFIYKARVKPNVDPNTDIINTAMVSAMFGEAEVETECSAMLDVLLADVECEKDVSLDGINFFPTLSAAECQEVAFRVIVTNNGEADLYNITIDDLLPPEYSNAAIVNGPCTANGNQISCTIPGPIASGGTATVMYRAQFDGDVDGAIVTNTANVSATPGVGPTPAEQGEPVTTSCSADVMTLVADIECEKAVSLTNGNFTTDPIEAVPGQEVFFRVRLQNTGSAPFFSTIVLDEIDSACYSGVQVVNGTGCSVQGTTIECDLGGLAPGGTKTIVYKATVIAEDRLCPNEARVTGFPGTDFNPGCAAVSTCGAQVNVLNVEIICDKNVSTDGINFFNEVAAEPGDTVWYEVLISIPQGGEACFINVSLTDVLPPQLTNIMIVDGASCSVNVQTINCTDIGPVPFCPGDPPLRVVYKADLITGDLPETIINTATVTGTPGIPGVGQGGTPKETMCSSTIRVLDLEIECVKTATPTPVVDGQTVTFEVVITNTSKSDEAFEMVKLTDTLSPGFTNIQIITPPGGLCAVNQGTRTITCNDLGPLAQGEQHVVRYTADVSNPPGDTLSNDAEVTGTFGEIVKTSQCPVTIPVLTPCIQCVKEATLSPNDTGYMNPISVIPGQRVFFRVTITNCGDAPLFKVSLEDVLPGGFSNVSVDEGACVIVGGNTVRCDDLGPLDPDESLEVRFSADLDDNQPEGMLTNIATVTGFPGTEGNPGETVVSNCPLPIDVLNIDFECTKQVSLDGLTYFNTVEAVPGQRVFFRVIVENTGEVPVKMTMTDDIGDIYRSRITDNGAICAFTGSVLECTFDLAAGESRMLDYSAEIKPSTNGGTYTNTVDLSVETGPEENPGASREKTNACAANVVVLEPEIFCEKGISINGTDYFNSLVVLPEDHVFYRVIIRNDGQTDLRNVKLEDMLPENCFVNVVVTSPTPECGANGNMIECDLGDLAEGDFFEIFYEADVKLEPADECPNTAMITADTGSEENPGAPVETECSAFATTLIIKIPTVTEVGFLILCLMLGGAMLLYRRMR